MENRRKINPINHAKKPRQLLATLRITIIWRDLKNERHNKDLDKGIVIDNIIINIKCWWNRLLNVNCNLICLRH